LTTHLFFIFRHFVVCKMTPLLSGCCTCLYQGFATSRSHYERRW
jgi:hypothetical protein